MIIIVYFYIKINFNLKYYKVFFIFLRFMLNLNIINQYNRLFL